MGSVGRFRSSLMPWVYTQVHEVRNRSRGPHARRGAVTFLEGETPPCRRGPSFKQLSRRKTAASSQSITCSTFVARFCTRPGVSKSPRRGGHQRATKSQLQQVRMAAFRALGNRTGRAARRLWEWRHQCRSRADKCSECFSRRSRRPTPERKSARI